MWHTQHQPAQRVCGSMSTPPSTLFIDHRHRTHTCYHAPAAQLSTPVYGCTISTPLCYIYRVWYHTTRILDLIRNTCINSILSYVCFFPIYIVSPWMELRLLCIATRYWYWLLLSHTSIQLHYVCVNSCGSIFMCRGWMRAQENTPRMLILALQQSVQHGDGCTYNSPIVFVIRCFCKLLPLEYVL